MMRKLWACLAVLALLTAASAAMATQEYDFSGLTITELYDVRAQLDAAIEAVEASEGSGFYDDGSYLVGSDLPEGDYAVQERENAMFASVVVRTGDSVEDALILHKLVSGQADIHLPKNVWVTFSEVRVWPLGSEPAFEGEDGAVGEGAYLVGTQLPAGRYTVSVADKAPLSSYSVYSGIVNSGEQLIKFEVLHGDSELELVEGNYIELSGATMRPAP